MTNAARQVKSAPGKPRVVPRHPVPGPHNAPAGDSGEVPPCLLDQPGAVFTTSGRAAILLGLEALALTTVDRVLVPSYHCPTMVSPVLALGHQLGFYPIGPDGRPVMDWLEQHAPADTRVICVAHFFGLPLDLREMQAWCRRRGVVMLEDCAHAMFGESPGGAIGTTGDVVIASLPKFFAVQEGGLLRAPVLNRPIGPLRPAGLKAELKALIDAIEISEQHGRLGRWSVWATPLLAIKRMLRRNTAAQSPLPEPTQFDPKGDYARIDMAVSHCAPTHATVRATMQAGRARIVAKRRMHYRAMAEALSDRRGMRPLFPALPVQCAPYVFPLWVDDPEPVYRASKTLGVPVSRWDWLWPGVPDIDGDYGKSWSRHVLQLHCHQDMSDEDRDWIVSSLIANRTSL